MGRDMKLSFVTLLLSSARNTLGYAWAHRIAKPVHTRLSQHSGHPLCPDRENPGRCSSPAMERGGREGRTLDVLWFFWATFGGLYIFMSELWVNPLLHSAPTEGSIQTTITRRDSSFILPPRAPTAPVLARANATLDRLLDTKHPAQQWYKYLQLLKGVLKTVDGRGKAWIIAQTNFDNAESCRRMVDMIRSVFIKSTLKQWYLKGQQLNCLRSAVKAQGGKTPTPSWPSTAPVAANRGAIPIDTVRLLSQIIRHTEGVLKHPT